MIEKEIEDEIVKYAESEGGLCVKLEIKGERGWPDRTLLFPGGVIAFVEVKTPTGKLKHQQVYWITVLRKLGFYAEVIRSLDEAVDFIKYLRETS